MAREVNEQEFRLIDRVSAGLQTIAGGIGRLRTGLTELNQGAELAAKGIGLVRSAAESIGGAVQGVADYQTAMARVNQITQATAEEQKALAAAVQSAQVELGVSADVSANALLKLARDGASATEAVNALGGVLAYAKANAQDAGAATEQLGGILDSFGERPAIIGKLADALTATAVASGTTSEALAKGLQGIGLAADEAGLSVNQTVALLGQLATRNIEGTAATKQLVTILGQFRDPASAAGKALADLGLSGQSFTEILGKLSTDSTAATAVLNTLGNKPRAALQALLADGGGALKQLNQIIGQSEGSAKKAADALGKTFEEGLNKASAAFQGLKIAALEPILEPLTNGLISLATRLNEVAQSPEFANLANQFAQFVTKSTEALTTFIGDINFEQAAAKVAGFTQSAVENFGAIVKAANLVARALNFATEQTVAAGEAIGNTAGATFGPLQIALEKAGGAVSDVSTKFDELKAAAAAPRKNLSELVNQTLGVKTGLDGVSKAARISADELRALSIAALPGPLQAIAKAALDASTELGRIPEPAKLVADGFGQVKSSAYEAALGFERLQIATLNRALSDLYAANLQGTDSFRAIIQQVILAEGRIRDLQKAHEDAAKAAGDQTTKVDETTRAVRDFGSAAESAGQSARDAGDETKKAGDEIENFGKNAAAAAFDLGKMSTEFLAQNTAAASAQASYRNYLEVLNLGTKLGKDQIEQFERRLNLSKDIIRANDEEAQALDRLAKAYPAVSRDALRELYEAEKKITEIREKKNRVTADGLGIEQAAAKAASGTAGALGFGARPAGDGRTAANPDAPAGAGSSSKTGSVVINVSGILTDELAREIAERVQRVQRLGR
jgi:TP901 family phage tail tape measure protein